MDLSRSRRDESTEELISIQKTKFRLRRTIPKKLCTLWSDLLTDIALGMADASKESEARKALRRYLMVKAVLVQPVRGGGCHQNRNLNQTERLMYAFWKGKEDEVWQTALKIERSRQKKRADQQKKRKSEGRLGSDIIQRKSQITEIKRRSDRAKVLTNDGELSKAFATMVQRGVAPSTDNIIAQLTKKFPKRERAVSWPDINRINELRNLVEKMVSEMDVDERPDEPGISSSKIEGIMSESLEELQKSIENDFQAVQVQWEDIFKSASRAKKSTGGGLCQLTPWHLKSAVVNSPGNKCAKILAQWSNRWARGDFDISLGAIFAMSRLIPIYKDWDTDDVRPVACGSAMRRLMGRALAEKIRGRVEGLTSDHQLGLKRTGYEIGIHSARYLAKTSRFSNMVILLLDFENAFNRADRALLLHLAIALVPEAANVLWWLYEKETILVTNRGDEVTCSTGVMQGCSFAAIAFALVVKWLISQMSHPGLERKQFFMDDGLLFATPEAMKWCLELITKLEPISGLKLKWTKMSVHAPNALSAQACRKLLPAAVQVIEDEKLNFGWRRQICGEVS